LILDKPLDLSYASVRRVDPAARKVWVNIGPALILPHHSNGPGAGLTCTDEAMKRSWKCAALGYNQDKVYEYTLEGDVRPQDFPEGSMFRLWECGVGDTARIACHVWPERDENKSDAYRLRANTPVTLRSAARQQPLVFEVADLDSGRQVIAQPLTP
jgi:hypothetical protein